MQIAINSIDAPREKRVWPEAQQPGRFVRGVSL
jgi:hypothetical protein